MRAKSDFKSINLIIAFYHCLHLSYLIFDRSLLGGLLVVLVPDHHVLLHSRWLWLSPLTLLLLFTALSSRPDVALCRLWFLWCFWLLFDPEIIKFLQTFLSFDLKMSSISMSRFESSMLIFQAIGFSGVNSNIVIKKLVLINLNNDRFMLLLLVFLDPNELVLHFDHPLSFLGHMMISKHLNSLFSSYLRIIRLSVFLILEIQLWNHHIFIFIEMNCLLLFQRSPQRWLYFLVIRFDVLWWSFLLWLLLLLYTHDFMTNPKDETISYPNQYCQNHQSHQT